MLEIRGTVKVISPSKRAELLIAKYCGEKLDSQPRNCQQRPHGDGPSGRVGDSLVPWPVVYALKNQPTNQPTTNPACVFY